MTNGYNKKKVDKKAYGVSLPKNLVNRLQFIKKLKKGDIDISKEMTPLFYELIEKLEKEASIKSNSWYDNRKCPNCDSYLVVKSSKNGDFYGCHNYPRCKTAESKKKEDKK
jgi:hypothetical protein